MNIKKIYIITCLCLAAVSIFLFRVNRQLYKRIEYLESIQPYLSPEEKISYFDIVGVDNQLIDAETLNSPNNKPYLIFIFQRPCTPCNKNLTLWGKMARILKDEVNTVGIILDDQQRAIEFSEKAGLNFKLYVPQDIDRFKKSLRIRINVAQSILYYKGKVVHISIGNLKGDAYSEILSTARKISKN